MDGKVWKKYQSNKFSDIRMSDIEELKQVVYYFKMLFTDEMFKHIAHYTNLCSTQLNITNGSITTDKNEIER